VRRGLIWNEEPRPRNRNDVARDAVFATLALAGPRVKKLCWFDAAPILALCEVHPRRARQLMGYDDSRTTADVYEQDVDDFDYAIKLLETVMGCALAEAHEVFAKRRVSVASAETPAKAGVEDRL
jgi:hypothetical protein